MEVATESKASTRSSSASPGVCSRDTASVAMTPSQQTAHQQDKSSRNVECCQFRCHVRTLAQPSDDLGEALLVLAKMSPTCRCPRPPPNATEAEHTRLGIVRRRRKSDVSQAQKPRTYRVLIVPIAFMVACEVAFTMQLPERVEQFIGGILLAASSGTLYLLLCFLMTAWTRTQSLGSILLHRSNVFSWQRDRLRFFLEVCSWMASVWFTYLTFHSEVASICGGAIAAILIALFSDFAAAYARVVESRLHHQSSRARESVAWLKVGLSYICVGYVLTASWRNLWAFLSGEVADIQSLEELVVTYLLIMLVGVSLIVASELLLLYEPTRNAGIALQSRIVDARYNWEHKTMRSLVESTAVLASTIVAYQGTQDMMLSLQTGTLTGIAIIVAGESISSNVLLFSRRRDELPADHWVKLLPLGVMMICFSVQVGTTLMKLVFLPTYAELRLMWFVFICAVALTVVALTDSSLIAGRLRSIGMRFGVRVCIAAVTLVAGFVCSGWPAVAFSTYLAWFCSSLSRECWYEIEMKENLKQAEVKSGCPVDEIATAEAPAPASVMAYVRVNYSYLYKRVKWTFISIVIVSIVDVCSTIFLLLNHGPQQLSLSQFSACNVVVSTGVGYLTSTISHELRPEVLAQTGFKHFTNKWVLFPLHALVETAVFVGVFIGTFTTSSTVFSSLSLASLSGIVVSVGGHWVRSRLNLKVGTEARVQLTATCAIMFCVFLIAWVSFLCLFSIYHHIDSIEAAFCLASLAGVFFLASSELFLLWEPTREIGHILQSRVTHAKDNWNAEPLRSFLEFFTWFAVIIGSFVLYQDLLLAIQLGTFSGIAVTLSGEFYRRKRSLLIPLDHDEDDRSHKTTSDRPRVLPAMLLFAYIGSGTFQWIFENIRSIEVTVLLATTAGFAFLCVADLLVQYKPTRWAGIILQDRFLRARDNWIENPVRSFVELGCFLGVIYGSYAIYGDLVVATQVGTVSGMLVTLIGEQVRSHSRVIPVADTVDPASEKAQVLPLPVMSLLGLVGAIAFNIIYTHLRSIEIAFVLATTSGVAFASLGDVFVIWKPTRKVGLILQDRVVYIQYNWKIHPLRSLVEILMCAVAWYLSYVFIWPKDLLVAILAGTATGIVACVCDELTTEYLTTYEQKMRERAAKTSARTNPQLESVFLALPVELQFHVGYFLTPEDLLVTRATCHKVNNMLRAESARYWLYASIRRKFGGGRRSTSGSNAERTRGQSRSLIYEVLTMIIPKILASRDPTDVLASGIGLSRALKWVYLNADWIRVQGLQPLADVQPGNQLRFVPGDVAFEVFRHIPDKHCLGISIEHSEEDASIVGIQVPVHVYVKLQADPLSFVAAETLSEIDAFSNWHVAIVAFFAMTLIFIGQLSSDLLRKHVFPESFWWPG